MIEARRARLRHGTVVYTDVGAGAPVVLLHGLGGNWQNWLRTSRRSRRATASSPSICPASVAPAATPAR